MNDVLQFPEKEVLVSSIWEKDEKRQNYIEKKGYDFYIFWETDIKRNKEWVEYNLIEITGD